MRNTIRVLAVMAAASLALVAGTSPAQASHHRVVLSEGHVDVFAVELDDDELELHVHDEETDTEYEPHEVTLRVKPEAETEVPDHSAFSFLGDPGDPIWVLPQAEDEDLLFAGFSAEEIDPGELVGDQVKVTVLGVVGPGKAFVYLEDPAGLPAEILVDGNSLLPDTVTLAAGQHLHANWVFTAPGHYLWLVTATGKLSGDSEPVSSGLSIYHFHVG